MAAGGALDPPPPPESGVKPLNPSFKIVPLTQEQALGNIDKSKGTLFYHRNSTLPFAAGINLSRKEVVQPITPPKASYSTIVQSQYQCFESQSASQDPSYPDSLALKSVSCYQASKVTEGFWVRVFYDVLPPFCTCCSHNACMRRSGNNMDAHQVERRQMNSFKAPDLKLCEKGLNISANRGLEGSVSVVTEQVDSAGMGNDHFLSPETQGILLDASTQKDQIDTTTQEWQEVNRNKGHIVNEDGKSTEDCRNILEQLESHELNVVDSNLLLVNYDIQALQSGFNSADLTTNNKAGGVTKLDSKEKQGEHILPLGQKHITGKGFQNSDMKDIGWTGCLPILGSKVNGHVDSIFREQVFNPLQVEDVAVNNEVSSGAVKGSEVQYGVDQTGIQLSEKQVAQTVDNDNNLGTPKGEMCHLESAFQQGISNVPQDRHTTPCLKFSEEARSKFTEHNNIMNKDDITEQANNKEKQSWAYLVEVEEQQNKLSKALTAQQERNEGFPLKNNISANQGSIGESKGQDTKLHKPFNTSVPTVPEPLFYDKVTGEKSTSVNLPEHVKVLRYRSVSPKGRTPQEFIKMRKKLDNLDILEGKAHFRRLHTKQLYECVYSPSNFLSIRSGGKSSRR